ncbi:MAG TPA: JAB domain-containing protein [Puia sp.]|jgi:DNA repair protein RadC|nr:JAB domain-containing protein [Puia sp.]
MENGIKQNEMYKIAEVEVSYRTKVKASDRPKVIRAEDAYKIFLQKWDRNKIELLEEFKVMYLNRASHVMFIYDLSSGGLTGTIADPRLIFVIALQTAACNILLAHNHPSGNLKPSSADEEITIKIKEAGKLLDIKLLDHLIVSEEGFYSFADEGLI